MRIPCDLDGLDALGESWIEIVAKEDAPVRSGTLRRLRQALRWADSALRAERRPRGLAPEFGDEDWAAISATGWENCGRCWEAAGDHQRASQAFENARAPGASTQAHRQKRLGFLADEQRFLAETFGR